MTVLWGGAGSGLAALDNPPFAMKLQRMGHQLRMAT
jgi:hypothetical protein